MSRHDPPRGVSGVVVAAALALGGAVFLPAPRASEGREPPPVVECAPEDGAASAPAGSAAPR